MNCQYIVFLTIRYAIIHLRYSYRRCCINSACDLIDRLPDFQLFGLSQGEFMSLIRRTLLVVLLVALLAVPILLYALNSTLNSGLAHIERDEANQYLDRAEDALTNRIQDLITVSRSLSRSDAAYLYAASPNPFFDEETFATSNLLEQGVNLIAVVNNAGEILNVRLINLSSYQDLPLSTNLTQALGSPQLYQHLIRGGSEIAVDAVSSGLISVDGRLMMVSLDDGRFDPHRDQPEYRTHPRRSHHRALSGWSRKRGADRQPGLQPSHPRHCRSDFHNSPAKRNLQYRQ